MSVATLTEKGQVTIPKDVRERLGLHTGDKIDFRAEGERGVRLIPISRRVAEVFGFLSGNTGKGIDVEEMDRKMGKAFKKDFR